MELKLGANRCCFVVFCGSRRFVRFRVSVFAPQPPVQEVQTGCSSCDSSRSKCPTPQQKPTRESRILTSITTRLSNCCSHPIPVPSHIPAGATSPTNPPLKSLTACLLPSLRRQSLSLRIPSVLLDAFDCPSPSHKKSPRIPSSSLLMLQLLIQLLILHLILFLLMILPLLLAMFPCLPPFLSLHSHSHSHYHNHNHKH